MAELLHNSIYKGTGDLIVFVIAKKELRLIRVPVLFFLEEWRNVMNKENLQEIKKIVLIVAIVVLLITYSEEVIGTMGGIIDVFYPFLAGVGIAFVINIPMTLMEEKLLKKWTKPVGMKIKRPISLTAAILIVVAVVSFVTVAVIPQLIYTLKDIGLRIPEFSTQVAEYISDYTESNPQIQEILDDMSKGESFDMSGIMDGLGSFMQSGLVGKLISSTYNVASSIAAFLLKTIIAICFAIYLLVSKEKILRNIKTVFQTYMPKHTFDYLYHATMVLSENFRKFIAGQCLEAVILGLIFAVTMAVFRIPYILLISVLIAFTSLIPVAGAFIGCFVGALLILIVSPVKMVEFLIIFIVLQQIENKLIYPRIVGTSVGLPAIWVFMAVTVGGSLCGVLGMLVFIPLASSIYMLLKEDIRKRRNKC